MPARILIADPDVTAANTLARHFGARGWKSRFAADAVSAIGTARSYEPDAIVISIPLPGGGVPAIERLRANVHTAGIPIIAIVRHRTDGDRVRAAGARELAAAPADGERVAALVERWLGAVSPPVHAPESTLHDTARVAALHETGLMEPGADAALDALTRLTTQLLDVPTALVSLVDEDRQRFKSRVGLEAPMARHGETPLSHSFCQWVVAGDEDLVVSDARLHPTLQVNAAVLDLGVVAYAGVPIETATGQKIGSFCAIDSVPRHWSDADLQTLRDLSDIGEAHIAMTEPGAAHPDRQRVQMVAGGIRGAVRILRQRGLTLPASAREALLATLDRQGQALETLSREAGVEVV